MSSKSLAETLSSLQEELRFSGIDDALARETLSYRLLVERIGESGNNDWWDSIIFTETGRDRFEEVTPKTAVKARIELAQRVGLKAEREILPDNTLSLFYLGPTAEAQIQAELNSVQNDDLRFEKLEDLRLITDKPGWTEGLADDFNISRSSRSERIEVGEESLTESDLQSRNTRRKVARRCFSAYGHSTHENLRVPYYKVEQ